MSESGATRGPASQGIGDQLDYEKWLIDMANIAARQDRILAYKFAGAVALLTVGFVFAMILFLPQGKPASQICSLAPVHPPVCVANTPRSG
jgi:hypothetical protein